MNILYICLDFWTWAFGRSHSYLAGIGPVHGLHENGANIDLVIIPANGVPHIWLDAITKYYSNRHYDQVWAEVVHNPLGDGFLEWLESLAPVRVGIVGESLEMFPESDAWLSNRKQMVTSRLSHFTHALTGDEADVSLLENNLGIKAKWLPVCVPDIYLTDPSGNPDAPAIFYGSIYGIRQTISDHPTVKPLLTVLPTIEAGSDQESRFELANAGAALYTSLIPGMLCYHADYIARLRQEIFQLLINRLRGMGCASVNLPTIARGYGGRVAESMAAGLPVISWNILERPRTAEMFKDGYDILLFDKDSPETLAEAIKKAKDPEVSRYLSSNAIATLRERYTTKIVYNNILTWITATS